MRTPGERRSVYWNRKRGTFGPGGQGEAHWLPATYTRTDFHDEFAFGLKGLMFPLNSHGSSLFLDGSFHFYFPSYSVTFSLRIYIYINKGIPKSTFCQDAMTDAHRR